jgi:hypothetical protein
MKAIKKLVAAFLAQPRDFQSIVRTLPAVAAGFQFANKWHTTYHYHEAALRGIDVGQTENPLRDYFDRHRTGRGIWKWNHYFDIYHRHFGRFVGREVSVVEIGIYSGGSLGMWKAYFGERSSIYGVDIEKGCTMYEETGVRVFIGDQANRSFWKHFKQEVSIIDIVIDDGGHTPEQQTVTLEEMLPHLRPGGVYLCEDVHGDHHEFAAYVSGLASHLNCRIERPAKQLVSPLSEFQRAVYSIHLYPFVAVIERSDAPTTEFVAPKHGTEWQPFL